MNLQNLAVSKQKCKGCTIVSESPEQAEKRLVQAAKAGQSAAFGKLSERHEQQLLRVTQRITRNREDSQDAVQDALLRAFVHLRDFDGRSSFATWLTRIAINSALMMLRKKRTSLEIATARSDDLDMNGAGFQIADRAPNPERLYTQSEEEKILKKAIHSLRPNLREVVEVQQLQELSMQETAQAMRISVAAAKGRLFHAKVALRRSPALRLMHQSRCGSGFRVLSAA
jgi:RNA polymerase sigma factor (sigma-70 family)